MSDQKTYSIQEFRGMLAEHLRKEMREWEDVLLTLRKRELAKDDSHYEPGNHETPDTGVAPHMEPGNHEQHAFGPGGLAAEHAPDPIGSDTGVPMNGQPSNSTPGGEVCPMCNQPDLPGSCQCLGGTAPAGGGDADGFDRPDADLGADAGLGGGDLRMSEKPLTKAQKRRVTAHQVRAMATKKGEMAPGGGSSPIESGSGEMGGGSDTSGLAQSEMTHVCDAPLCTKGIKGDAKYCKAHKPKDEKPMKKDLASATADLKSKNQMLDSANKVRATKPMFQPKPFTKEEWIDIANEGDPVKRLTKYPSDAKETAVPASTGDKNAKGLGQGVEIKKVPGATSEGYPVSGGVNKKNTATGAGVQKGEYKGSIQPSREPHGPSDTAPEETSYRCESHQWDSGEPCPKCKAKKTKKAEVPMAKPPSGQNMGTAVPKAKVQAPKLPGAGAAPAAPAAPKLPGMKTPKLGGMIQTGSGTPAGTLKNEKGFSKPQDMHGREHEIDAGGWPKGTETWAAKPKASKPQSQPVKKAMMPAHKQMAMQANSDAHKAHQAQGQAPAPSVKLPGMAEQDQRAQMYSDFMPKPAAGPNVPGLKAPPAAMTAKPAAPKLPGMGKPMAPAPKPMFGKGEMEDLKCSMCKGQEHSGECK